MNRRQSIQIKFFWPTVLVLAILALLIFWLVRINLQLLNQRAVVERLESHVDSMALINYQPYSYTKHIKQVEKHVVRIKAIGFVTNDQVEPYAFDDFFSENKSIQPSKQVVKWGTGVLVEYGDEIHLLTAAHVVEHAEEIACFSSSGVELKADVVAIDTMMDLALLKMYGKIEQSPIQLALSGLKQLANGEMVIMIGFAYGEQAFSIVDAIASTFILGNCQGLGISKQCPRGMSGGGAFTLNGEFVGIISASTSTKTAEAFTSAVSINCILSFLSANL